MNYNEVVFRIITGSIIASLGFFIFVGGVLDLNISTVFGVVIMVVGIIIILNKKEDEIEQIKSTNKKDYE